MPDPLSDEELAEVRGRLLLDPVRDRLFATIATDRARIAELEAEVARLKHLAETYRIAGQGMDW